MAGQTAFTFTSTGASDEDGDTLTKTWTSSDGGSGTGDTFTRTFATAGSFQVNLKVSDGKLEGTTPAASVTVGPNLTGTWAGASEPGFNCPISLSLTQSGTTITGTRSWVGGCSGTGNLASGSASVLTHPTAVTLVTNQFTLTGLPGVSFTERYVFNTDADGTSMTGTITTTLVQTGATVSASGTLRKQ